MNNPNPLPFLSAGKHGRSTSFFTVRFATSGDGTPVGWTAPDGALGARVLVADGGRVLKGEVGKLLRSRFELRGVFDL